jgi:hypothetical protein
MKKIYNHPWQDVNMTHYEIMSTEIQDVYSGLKKKKASREKEVRKPGRQTDNTSDAQQRQQGPH